MVNSLHYYKKTWCTEYETLRNLYWNYSRIKSLCTKKLKTMCSEPRVGWGCSQVGVGKEQSRDAFLTLKAISRTRWTNPPSALKARHEWFIQKRKSKTPHEYRWMGHWLWDFDLSRHLRWWACRCRAPALAGSKPTKATTSTSTSTSTTCFIQAGLSSHWIDLLSRATPSSRNLASFIAKPF